MPGDESAGDKLDNHYTGTGEKHRGAWNKDRQKASGFTHIYSSLICIRRVV